MKNSEKIKKIAVYGMLTAMIIALQILCTFIKFGPFSITLALTPIIIGAAVFGMRGGAVLGFVFGAVVLLTGLFGWDGGFILAMMNYNGIYSVAVTVLVCLLKGILAGVVSALVFRLFAGKSGFAASLSAAIAAPIVNTGLFALAMLTVFSGFLTANVPADGSMSATELLFLSWIGANFIVEFVTNIILSTVTMRVVPLFRRGTYNK